MKGRGKTQADAGWARLREEVGRRINAQLLPCEVKVEIWEKNLPT